jgi:YidC/Oxa1 family membrane protein insertase
MSIFDSGSKEDNKRTIIAVVLSVVIVTVGFMLQNTLFPPAPTPAASPLAAAPESPVAAQPGLAQAVSPVTGSSKDLVPLQQTTVGKSVGAPSAPGTAEIEVPLGESSYTISTDLYEAVLSNAGGELLSLKLKKHKDRGGFVDLIVKGSTGTNGISVAFGPYGSPPSRELMKATWLDSEKKTIEFSRTLYASVPGSAEKVPFTYRKAFMFRDEEYMFGLAITLENSKNEYIPLDQNGFAYSVSIGPQIGPNFDTLSKNADFRKFIIEAGGKKKVETPKPGVPLSTKEQASWAAISGKYFCFIAIPDLSSFATTFFQGTDPEIKQTNLLYISRPAIKASKQTDAYYFFFGPKTSTALARYDYADRNAFARANLRLEDSMETSNILGWLESILKFFLNFFYKLIPNYGIAIILTTILMKAIMFPLTKQGSIGSARMQELQPQMAELQAKYKGNPQKLNQEMAEFYKREKYNPMSGCLPMLIQFPLFIAMYNLFNNHFDLRGASFIPGWIGDLSMPESVVNFGNFALPILGWHDLRALPIIYVASQLLYGKFTQTPSTGQNASQMKLMMYGMPIMFFFILYDVPSGLLLYWIASNILTIVQQIAINDMLKKRKAHAKAK